MGWETTVEAVAAGTGASVTVAALARRWFRQAVKSVVDERVAESDRRTREHLDRQDARLVRIENKLNQRR